MASSLTVYQHDELSRFRFKLLGVLDAAGARQLEYCWRTAASVLRGKQLVVDTTCVSVIDAAGESLLERMQQAGATLIAEPPPAHGCDPTRLCFGSLRRLLGRFAAGRSAGSGPEAGVLDVPNRHARFPSGGGTVNAGGLGPIPIWRRRISGIN